MHVYRIAEEKYAYKLTASGAPNRWNRQDQFVLYCGAHRSLSALELIVHRANKRKDTYKTMVISLAEDPMLFTTFERKQLPHNWRSFLAEEQLRELGSVWYRDQKTPILRVPSIIIPQEYNYVLNTAHPLFSEVVELTEVENFFWDKRL